VAHRLAVQQKRRKRACPTTPGICSTHPGASRRPVDTTQCESGRPAYLQPTHIIETYLLVPVTTGSINKNGMDFLSNLGTRIKHSKDDHRESVFLFQQLSVLIKHRHAIAHNPQGWNVAVSASALRFSLVFSPRDLYYRGKKHDNNNTMINKDLARDTACIKAPDNIQICFGRRCQVSVSNCIGNRWTCLLHRFFN